MINFEEVVFNNVGIHIIYEVVRRTEHDSGIDKDKETNFEEKNYASPTIISKDGDGIHNNKETGFEEPDNEENYVKVEDVNVKLHTI